MSGVELECGVGGYMKAAMWADVFVAVCEALEMAVWGSRVGWRWRCESREDVMLGVF